MNDIIIYGAGGFGRETALLIEDINQAKKQWNILGFVDDSLAVGSNVDSYSVIGGSRELNSIDSEVSVVIAVGDSNTRKSIFDSITNSRISYPILVHPTAQTGSQRYNRIGRGSIIAAGCILTTNVRLGDFALINLMTTIGHDVTLGNFVSIMPGCSISGLIKGGNQIFIGTGVRILPEIKIGEGCIIGAGSVVTKDVKPFEKVVGVPARPF